ncbi:MAG: Translation initiation factor IF-3 [Candidatus Latescibacteria bacterium ADurb.Bin168]|nr:MAG: Translation initiation factor IF-3 [Candidatus Latescibacteria bacterium ADurb.Bin168]
MISGAAPVVRGKKRTGGNRLRANREISAPRVFLVGADGVPVGEVTRAEALRRASECGFDLIEVQPGANPPVCRLGKRVGTAAVRPRPVEAQRRTLWVPAGCAKTDFRLKIAHGRRFLAEGGVLKVVVPVEESPDAATAEQVLGKVVEAFSECARPGAVTRSKTELTMFFLPVTSSET